MEAKDTLFHINWGDGDTTFVIAPDEETAKARMPDGKDMVNYVVKLDGLYQMILKTGTEVGLKSVILGHEFFAKQAKLDAIREVVGFINNLIIGTEGCAFEERLDGDKGFLCLDMNENQWQAKQKEWGIDED